ncbi:NACHT domain-containing protein [Limnoraphis robusta]|uniref:NACHT domain-containing protein n=1 Tax=Limnoraphis robusta CCNP1315 TaxID=3110306 RepID=A0ABU5TV73_9CYAN|nr:NACHT domain-containing protein [Limnoraphis robusta]MEA5518607.1 NACHT domain-containing protein [Limnoraphis robusta CCNP1315]MEA5547998.1 NACHT domain-containing protein [Limnoraphis robusta CCNP1324]
MGDSPNFVEKMPRTSYGPQTQKRTKQLLAALLDYANDELEADEIALERLQREIKIDWKNDRQLIVQTKLRFLEALMKLTGNALTIPQIKEALNRLMDFLEILDDHRPVRRGSEIWHFTLKFWHKRRDRTAILQQFDSEWQERRPQTSKQVSPSCESPENPDYSHQSLPPQPLKNQADNLWWKWCQDSLQTQQIQRLTTNPLTVSDGVTFEVQEVYVPLGLIECKFQPELQTEQDWELNDGENTDSETVIDPELFLQQLLTAEIPQRIGIIGEPGSGKTTLLQNIANKLLEHQFFPIWISLADLQGETLEQYLLQNWLRTVTCQIILSPELQQQFAELFQQGRVWLLLDAIDEMAIESSAALTFIARQLRGWIANAHVIITCRMNVWEMGKNPLQDFVTYRNLSFCHSPSQSENQVQQFIQKWFIEQPQLGIHLYTELQKPERQRIADTVKNPLCLALLCRTWTVMQGNFPSTKSALYQQFIQTLYEWKQEIFSTSLAQRKRLNKVLGKLALNAFSQTEMKFRFSQSFVETVLNADEIDLFSLALQLGWLHSVGISATTGDRVYAFYHSTFQEYFAAQAIENWQFFINQDSPQPLIFSLQWREIILLWLGRLDIPASEKEAFIQALVNFPENYGKFHQYRAYFLAAVGLAEFPEFSQADDLINQLIHWCYGEFDSLQEKWLKFPTPILERARTALFSTNRQRVIVLLEKYLESLFHPRIIWLVAYSLGKNFDPGNKVAEKTLIRLLETAPDQITQMNVSYSLGQVSVRHPLAIKTLIEILNSASEDTLRRKVAYRLGKIDPGNTTAIDLLINLIQSPLTSRKIRSRVIKDLREIAPEHPFLQKDFAMNVLSIKLSRNTPVNSCKYTEKTKIILEQRLTTASEMKLKRKYAISLIKIQLGHPEAISTLIESLQIPGQTIGIYKRTIEVLKKGLLPEQLSLVVTILKNYGIAVNQGERSDQALEIYKLLWYCVQQMSYADFCAAWNSV